MPSATRRRPPQPQPQTRRCRYEGQHGRCTHIATQDGFCGRHLEEIAADVAKPTLGESILGLFTGTPRQQRRAQEHVLAGLGQVVQRTIDRRWPAPGAPGAPDQVGPGQPGPPPPPRPRVSPEAIERRKRQIAARATLGFEADEPLTVEAIRKRRQELMRVWHTDKASGPDPTREKMVRRINEAADLLLAPLRPPAATP